MLYIIGYIVMIVISASIFCKLDILSSPYEEYFLYTLMGLAWWFTLPMLLLTYTIKFIDKVILK